MAETPHWFIFTTTTDHDITNTGVGGMYENVRRTLNHWIIQNAEKNEQCSSVPKQNEQLYKTGSARGDAWLRRISANNLLQFLYKMSVVS